MLGLAVLLPCTAAIWHWWESEYPDTHPLTVLLTDITYVLSEFPLTIDVNSQ